MFAVTEQFYDSLLNFGMGGLFIAFLVYNYLSNQKRLDKQLCHFTDRLKEQSEKFTVHLKEVQQKSDDTEEKLRTRYDGVIAGLQKEKSEFNTSILERANEALRQFEGTKADLEGLRVQTNSIEILLRDAFLVLNRIDDILKKSEEERRVTEMAKRLRAKDHKPG